MTGRKHQSYSQILIPFWKVSCAPLGLYFPVVTLFGKWFEAFRWEILWKCYISVIKVGLMTTSFPLKGFPWSQHPPWRWFCRILLVLLPLESLQDGLQLLVYCYKPMLRLVHLNTGENSITYVNFLITYALCIAKQAFASWLLQWHFLQGIAACETRWQC